MLSFGTRVSDRNADPNVVGLVLRLANDAHEYGEEEYVVRWQSGVEELAHRRDLIVVPDAGIDVRTLAEEAGLRIPESLDGAELALWLFQCLRRAYDKLRAIDQLLPYRQGSEYTERIQGLIDVAAAAREEVKIARARAEETRRELEAVAVRVVPASELKAGDVVYGLLTAKAYKAGLPVMWKAPPLRIGKPSEEDPDLLVVLGPDPTKLLEGL